ncbi:uncharacterized protein LOC119886723 [Tachysurus ichikawai]
MATQLIGKKLLWPPYSPKDTAQVRAAVKIYELPTEEWLSYEPVRHLVNRATYEEAEKSLKRYLQYRRTATQLTFSLMKKLRSLKKENKDPIPFTTEHLIQKTKLKKESSAQLLDFYFQAPVQSASRVKASVQPSIKILPNYPLESSDQMCSSSPYLTESSDSSALPAMYPIQEPSSKDQEGINSRSALAVLQADQ